MRQIIAAIVSCAVVGMTLAVVLEPRAFKRQLPADRLRDFPGMCFASTQCRVYNVSESWSLAPFCGKAACRIATNKEKTKRFLIEEVFDCGPAVDTEKSPDCVLLEAAEGHTEQPFPDCCPQWDCPEGTEVFYVDAKGSKEAK